MNVLYVNPIGGVDIKENTSILPRVGDSVDLYYNPYPKVSAVLLHPTSDTLGKLGLVNISIDAIVTIK